MIGEKREHLGGELHVGFAESRVIAINPDLEQLAKLGYNVDDKEEPEYLKDKDGVDTARIDIYFQEVKSGYKFKKAFFLENSDVVQKPKEDWTDEQLAAFTPKTQYINQVGLTAWALDEKGLHEGFTKFRKKKKGTEEYEVYGDKEFRIAKSGEKDLMGFIREWLDFNYFQAATNIFLDLKKIFNGNFKELQEHVGGELALNTIEILGVRTVDKEGDINQYQSVYKASLPGYLMKVIRNVKFTEANIEKWKNGKYHKTDNPKGRYLKNYEELAVEIMGEYGFKDYFELVPFKVYDEAQDTVGTTDTKKESANATSSDF